MSVEVLHGDCLELLPTLAADSIDAVVCDPPYLIEFMGRAFDRQHLALSGANVGQQMQAWHLRWAVEAMRVMKPGAFIAAFGGERSFHRLASALEDAGFEPRHTVCWVYASGFPKSRNVSKDLASIDWCDCDH